MLFQWLKKRRRQKLIRQPFPQEWKQYLEANVALYHSLNDREKQLLHDRLRIFLAEKNWEGCGGLELTEEIKVTVSGQVCLLVLGIEPAIYFDKVRSVLIYPSGYLAEEEDELSEARSGEAWYRGPVVLSWADVQYDGRHPQYGRNLVFHELAHQLDMLDGWIDGTPPLKNQEQYDRWRRVMTKEYQRLVRSAENGRPTLLDHYGATNEAEFFAVATECFFTQPLEMVQRHPVLYDLLREYYHQDPARRLHS